MHFPKVKIVNKKQYGNYHGELSCYLGFKFLFLNQTAKNTENVWQKKKLKWSRD